MQPNVYSFFLFISAIISATAVIYAWKRRSASGAFSLAMLLACITIWASAYAMEVASYEKSLMCLWLRIEYIGIAFVPLWCILFSFQFTGLDTWLTPRKIAAIAVIPVITLLLIWSNDLHGLYYRKIDVELSHRISVLVLTKGPWYWVNLGYLYASFLIMAWLILRMCWNRGPLYRNQAIIILTGMLLPITGNILYLTGITPFPNLDLSPFTFSLMGIITILGFFHYHLLKIVPIAREAVIEGMGDGVIVLDNDYRIVDLNPAARQLTGEQHPSPIGMTIDIIFLAYPELMTSCLEDRDIQQEALWKGKDNNIRHLDINIVRLKDRKGRKQGKIITLHDITVSKQLEMEKEELIVNLKDALARVKTLSGLLPICASCKKIRDDKGYWQQVEVYIRDRSDAKFTHGLCPGCAKALYPELDYEQG